MTLRELINTSNQISRDHGFWDDENNPSDVSCEIASMAEELISLCLVVEDIRKNGIRTNWFVKRTRERFTSTQIKVLSKLVLLITEISEAAEAVMSSPEMVNIAEEMSDIFIRWADLSKFLEEKLLYESEQEIAQKSAINSQRPRLHGKKA